MAIDTIIFDVGRVLVDYDSDYVLEKLIPNSLHKSLYKKDFLLSNIWLDLDKGVIDSKEAANQFQKKHPYIPNIQSDIQHIVAYFIDHLSLKEDSKSLFLELEKKYPIYILSNFQSKPFQTLIDRHPFIKKARGMVVSADVNLMKPEPAIYHYLLETYKLKASSCLFFDDMEENIQAAKETGMKGLVFTDAKQAKDYLNSLT